MKLHGVTPRYGASNSVTVLLENPVGKNVLDVHNLTKEVSVMCSLKINLSIPTLMIILITYTL